MTLSPADTDRRLLFLAATTKDGATTQAMLSPLGIPVEICRTFEALLEGLAIGAGAVLMPEEAATPADNAALCSVIAGQPPWSDLPVLILTRPGADSPEAGHAARTLGNVTLLERPVRLATLLTAVRTALRARDRQYQIREHLAERARAEESLRLADQRKDEFLATLGHELRNPLAPLLTGVQLLKSAGTQDPAVLRVSGVMERQITHLVRLVNDLLEVSRITRGLIEVHREPVDLAMILHASIDTSRPVLDAAGHQLSVDLPAEPVVVYGDAVRLTQVFANLLTNAAKYTNARGHIRIRVQRAGNSATVSVKDDGIGIAREQLTSVFELFTQVDRSGRRAQGGLGIGLTLVRSLVALHGGSVEARSDGLGAGSEFIISLPALTAHALKPSDSYAQQPFPARRILVVDDNRDAADTLGELLAALGATVSVAYSGRAALDAAPSFQPDVMLIDIGMPEMDGYEVARILRRTEEFRDVQLVALTGWGQEQDQQQSRTAGFDHHVVKPPDLDRLREVLTTGSQEEERRGSAGTPMKPRTRG